LTDDDYVVRVGNFKVTKADFWGLYPSIMAENGSPKMDEIGGLGERILADELIRQDWNAGGWTTSRGLSGRARWLWPLANATGRTPVRQEHMRDVRPDAASQPASRPPHPQAAVPRRRRRGRPQEVRRQHAGTPAGAIADGMQEYVDQAMAGGPDSRAAEKAGEAPEAVRAFKALTNRPIGSRGRT